MLRNGFFTIAVLCFSVCVVRGAVEVDATKSRAAVEALRRSDSKNGAGDRTPLTKADARTALEILRVRRLEELVRTRKDEVKAGRIKLGGLEMPFAFKIFGAKPKTGRSLFLSMHGGGNAPAQINDRQYENQKSLYKPEEGVYLAPRAPTNTWDLWHQSHIDQFFARVIEDMVACEDVNPNRVYLMGYSAGGDGVYQLAPRMADRFAAASMMAGHPNETSPLGLRNLPFAIHVGALDDGYGRNKVAQEWGQKLDELHKADGEGYVHLTELHAGRGHWMNREDASAVPWMAAFTRDPAPKKVVWKQDDVTHDAFYWLAVEPGAAKAGATVVASIAGNAVTIEKAEGVARLIVRLDDRLVDLDRPIAVMMNGKALYEGRIDRTIADLQRTLDERGDAELAFCAHVAVDVP